MLYKAFGWAPPQFAHLPLLLDENKAKLSKRNKHANVNSYMEEYLPAALLNFVAFLGWAPDNKREIFSLEELVKEVPCTFLSCLCECFVLVFNQTGQQIGRGRAATETRLVQPRAHYTAVAKTRGHGRPGQPYPANL